MLPLALWLRLGYRVSGMVGVDVTVGAVCAFRTHLRLVLLIINL